MPSTRSETYCWFLGQADNVLSEDWVLRFNQGKDGDGVFPLPFRDKAKLPTKEKVLKLMMFYKKKLKYKTSGEVAEMVLEEIYRYWRMANILVITHWLAKKQVLKLFEVYQKLVNLKTRLTNTEKLKRESFMKDLEKLFDIAKPESE